MDYDNKRINHIVSLQKSDGSWGQFHGLSKPRKEQPITTEQALRRLRVLGLTHNDEPVQKALRYMKMVLDKKITPPDRREKVLNWDYFEQMMMAAWIRLFVPDDEQAMAVALFWADIISRSFSGSTIKADLYEKEYRQRIPKLNAGEQLIAISQFYMVTLLWDVLAKDVENRLVDYIINKQNGIIYIYDNRVADIPAAFDSLQTSRYFGALECLSGYHCASEKLDFAVQWINSHKTDQGWDLGNSSNDGIYFPISNSWRKKECRVKDCTERINKLLTQLS